MLKKIYYTTHNINFSCRKKVSFLGIYQIML